MRAKENFMSKTQTPSQAETAKTVKVRLLKDHTADEKALKAGAELEVNEADAKWLVDNKVGELIA